MKKLAAIITTIWVILLFFANAYCDTTSKVFYHGNTYTLRDAFMSSDGEMYLDVKELSKIMNFTYQVSSDLHSVELKYKDEVINVEIAKNNTDHENPKFFSNTLYMPSHFISNNFNTAVKYNKGSSEIYLLPISGDRSEAFNSFTNLTYNYSLSVTDRIYMDLSPSEDPFDDGHLRFADKDNAFSVNITCEKIDSDTYIKMRNYLNDKTSTDKIIFEKIIDLKESYFRALKEYYKKDFLYGSSDDKLSESNIKVFKEYNEAIFDQPSHIAIYNIIKSDKNGSEETTNLSILLPDYADQTIYNIIFSLDKGTLDEKAIRKMSSFVNSMCIPGLPRQWAPLSVFSDTKVIEAANAGIYPSLDKIDISYSNLINSKDGYKITYPSVFIPYRENDISNSYSYKSYKIDYNSYFSISSEPANTFKPIQDKISLIRQLYDGRIKVVEEGKMDLSGNQYTFIKYEVSNGSDTSFVEDYFISTESMLYNIQLNSRLAKPAARIEEEFTKILSSLQFISTPAYDTAGKQPFIKYLNREEGYTFSFPTNWKLVENDSSDINYDSFSIKSPDFSGPIDITVTEGELSSYLLHTEITNFLSASNSNDFKEYFIKYSAPYIDRESKTLMSNYYIMDNSINLIKLVNYIDAGGRSKVCYSKEIIRGKKIYSLFITVSDYATVDENLFGNDLKAVFNKIINSFTIENTMETYFRFFKGETRNRKVVFIEDYLKRTLDKTAEVISASKLTSNGDILVIVNGSNSGYYRVKMDYNKKQIQVTERLLKKDVMSSAEENLKQEYMGKKIEEMSSDLENMTIALKYVDAPNSQGISRVYKIEPGLSGMGLSWKLLRKYDYQSLKSNCVNYLTENNKENATVFFPEEEELGGITYQDETHKNYFIPVYVQSNKTRGYYVLEVNPVTDKISTISFTELGRIYDQSAASQPKLDNEFILANQHIREKDPFAIDVFLISRQKEAFKMQTVRVKVDPTTHELKIQ